MIGATSTGYGPAFTINATVNGVAVYLDNFALIDLAKRDPPRRQRFIAALKSKGDLLFSVSNAVDLTGPQGESLGAVSDFLDEIGPHWFPVELNPFEVVERERNGASPSDRCVSEQFMRDYLAMLVKTYGPNSGRVISLSGDFFRLSAVLDWVGPQRDSIRKGMEKLDDVLIDKIRGYQEKCEQDSKWLDQSFPVLPFTPSMPAMFAYVNLVRMLIVEFKQRAIQKGDGLDFCHAVMASAFANIGALDKHWKRRVEGLPKPNSLARIYYSPELDRLVSDLESAPQR